METYQLTEAQRTFLEDDYCRSKFHMPDDVKRVAHSVTGTLEQSFASNFVGLCLVGGLTNGSYVLRCREAQKLVSTDVDFYLLVDDVKKCDLNGMADLVANEFINIGYIVDGVLNGRNPDNAFDLSDIDRHIAEEEFDF